MTGLNPNQLTREGEINCVPIKRIEDGQFVFGKAIRMNADIELGMVTVTDTLRIPCETSGFADLRVTDVRETCGSTRVDVEIQGFAADSTSSDRDADNVVRTTASETVICDKFGERDRAESRPVPSRDVRIRKKNTRL